MCKQYCDWKPLNISLNHNPQHISSDSHWTSVTLDYILLTETWQTHYHTMVLPLLFFSYHIHSTCSYWKWFIFVSNYYPDISLIKFSISFRCLYPQFYEHNLPNSSYSINHFRLNNISTSFPDLSIFFSTLSILSRMVNIYLKQQQ